MFDHHYKSMKTGNKAPSFDFEARIIAGRIEHKHKSNN